MSWAELLPHLVTLAVGLVGGGGIAAIVKARPERSQIYLLGAESAVKSLREALAEADNDNAALRAEVRVLREELAEERRCRVGLERRLAALEHGSQ